MLFGRNLKRSITRKRIPWNTVPVVTIRSTIPFTAISASQKTALRLSPKSANIPLVEICYQAASRQPADSQCYQKRRARLHLQVCSASEEKHCRSQVTNREKPNQPCRDQPTSLASRYINLERAKILHLMDS